METNRFDGEVPGDTMLLQAGHLAGGVHYHYHFPTRLVPRQVPPASRRLRMSPVWWEDQYRQLTAASDDGAVIAVLTGPAHAGKTQLALRWAHDHLDRWPDGQFHADLGPDDSGPTPPSDILGEWLEILGVSSDEVPDGLAARAADWRTHTADRQALLLLDDAVSAAQVRSLLPNNPHAFTLVTSRYHLAGLHTNGARLISIN